MKCPISLIVKYNLGKAEPLERNQYGAPIKYMSDIKVCLTNLIYNSQIYLKLFSFHYRLINKDL